VLCDEHVASTTWERVEKGLKTELHWCSTLGLHDGALLCLGGNRATREEWDDHPYFMQTLILIVAK
jgi:hypothetical protein